MYFWQKLSSTHKTLHQHMRKGWRPSPLENEGKVSPILDADMWHSDQHRSHWQHFHVPNGDLEKPSYLAVGKTFRGAAHKKKAKQWSHIFELKGTQDALVYMTSVVRAYKTFQIHIVCCS